MDANRYYCQSFTMQPSIRLCQTSNFTSTIMRVVLSIFVVICLIDCTKGPKLDSFGKYSNSNRRKISSITAIDSIVSLLNNAVQKKQNVTTEVLSHFVKLELQEILKNEFIPIAGYDHALHMKDADYYRLKDNSLDMLSEIVIIHEYKYIDADQFFVYLISPNVYSKPVMFGYFTYDGFVFKEFTRNEYYMDTIITKAFRMTALDQSLERFKLDSSVVRKMSINTSN
jgi:hypothetical protein